MAKKLTSGNGWSFEPAGGGRDETVRSLPDDKQSAVVRLEKRAKGKVVTAVSKFVLSDGDRKAVAAALRKHCGTGGSDQDGCIEVQGDHAEKVRAFLEKKGWRVK
ncbi:MAG: translation initiation factor [Planctomycetes bacterium]|nr:translation initiation factor [Planctomycetota bacterium]MCD7897099.1 translation initiation factor [Planctomycetaceae bacterium]